MNGGAQLLSGKLLESVAQTDTHEPTHRRGHTLSTMNAQGPTLMERFPVFAKLPADKREKVMGGMHLRQAPAGTVLFDAHRPCPGFPLLLRGSVRVVKASPNGREILLYRVEPGEGCIMSGGCLLGHSDYSASGIAEEDVTLLVIPPALFQQLIVEFESFREFVFGMYGARLAEVMEFTVLDPKALASLARN